MLAKAVNFYVMLCIAHGQLLQAPEDTEAVVGQDRIVLKCRKDVTNSAKTVQWRYRKTDEFEIVYQNGFVIETFGDRYQVVTNTTTGQYDLIIKDVALNDSGTYICADRGSQREAQLIVFEKYPSNEFCMMTSTSTDNHNDCDLESVEFSCSMRYQGNLKPILEWWDGENTMPSTPKNDTNGLIQSSIQLNKNQIEMATYTCRVKYRSSVITSRFAWSSTANTTPTANTTSLSSGGCDLKSIDCSEWSSHQCKYTWLAENGSELTHGSSMDLTEKPNGNYTCLATCSVLGTQCSYVVTILNYKCDDYSKQMTPTKSLPVTMTVSPEAQKSLPRMISPEIYVPVSIVAILIVTGVLLLIFRRSLCVCSARKSTTTDGNVENGQINNAIEMTHLNETTLQGTTISPARNTQLKQVNILSNGTPNIQQMQERNVLLAPS